MLPGGTYNVNYEKDVAIVRTRSQWGLLIAFLILLFAFPLFGSTYLVNLVNIIAITVITVLGLNILTGYCGQISLGHAGFMAVGAYVFAILVTKLGLSFWISLPLGGICAGLVGILFGLPSLRVKGFYLALATLAAQFIIVYVIVHLPKITGGVAGLETPFAKLGSFTFDSDQKMYFIVMAVTVLMTFFAKNIVRTSMGRSFVAVRDDDLAAEVLGINVYRSKLTAFFIGCFYAGIAGGLMAQYIGFIHPDHFTLMDSIWYLGMLIVGGLGSTLGGILGVIFVRLLQETIAIVSPMVASSAFVGVLGERGGYLFAALGLILFGVIVLVFLIYEPRGLAHRWERFKNFYRLWPFTY